MYVVQTLLRVSEKSRMRGKFLSTVTENARKILAGVGGV